METANLIYYSPTGTTQKIVREIGLNLGLKEISEKSITKEEATSFNKTDDNCLTIIGMPVYGGRLPLTAIENLKRLQSNQSPAVIVVVYGNREYEDALLELKELAINCGFKVIAGAAFIGEHSFSTMEQPIAKNRPDAQDLEKCKDFAQMIIEKLKGKHRFSEPEIPGNFPYKERKEADATLFPKTDNSLCNLCGVCVDSCPTNAITMQDTIITDGELCTLCCACIKNCPENARTLNNPSINALREKLLLNCSERKEPVYFVKL